MDQPNPFQFPNEPHRPGAGPPVEITPLEPSFEPSTFREVQRELEKSRGWALAAGLLGLLQTALIAWGVASIVWALGGFFVDPELLIIVITALVMVAMFGVGSLLLLRCAGRISEYQRRPSAFRLESVLAAQARFWTFVGAGTLLGLVLLVLVACMGVAG